MASTSKKDDSAAWKKAAVLLPLLLKDGPHKIEIRNSSKKTTISANTELLLTLRTDTVEHHKGQISFPGGRADEADAGDLLCTALRETEEEVGIHRNEIEIFGELPMTPVPRSLFEVHAFVGLIAQTPIFKINPHEILQLIHVPLSELLNPSQRRMETHEYAGVQYQIPAFLFENHRIWGATARMIDVFLKNFIVL